MVLLLGVNRAPGALSSQTLRRSAEAQILASYGRVYQLGKASATCAAARFQKLCYMLVIGVQVLRMVADMEH